MHRRHHRGEHSVENTGLLPESFFYQSVDSYWYSLFGFGSGLIVEERVVNAPGDG